MMVKMRVMPGNGEGKGEGEGEKERNTLWTEFPVKRISIPGSHEICPSC